MKYIAIVLGIAAFIFFNMGMDQINFSNGWNPVIAIPLSILMFTASYIAWNLERTEILSGYTEEE